MMAQKLWFKYTDESGCCWRIQTTAELAEIGGLERTDTLTFKPLPTAIKPRYIWLQEHPRPSDRLSARQKVILERDHLCDILQQQKYWSVGDKQMVYRSYYGEDVEAPPE